MKKAIEINVLRVSSNGKYIEFIINCPEDYYFTDFVIGVYGGDDQYSLKSCLFEAQLGDEDSIYNEDDRLYYHNKQYYSGQFKIEDLDVHVPEMYEITISAHHNPAADPEPQPECEQHPKVITTTAYISDVSKVYTCLMNDILSMGQNLCENSEVMDKLIRNYLILYAHQEAMHLRELTDARKYFTLLQNCFSTCGETQKTTCSLCNGSTLTEYVRSNTYKPSNCNCGK